MSELDALVKEALAIFPGATLLIQERKLREYQTSLVDQVREALRTHKRVLMQSCVGSGKTDVAGFIVRGARARGSRALFVCHRKELIDNAVERFVLWGIARDEIGVIRADDHRTNAAAPVQVASVQTLSRRPAFEVQPDIVIIDECHRAASASYTALVDQYPGAFFLGLSASPQRSDGRGLGSFFQSLVTGPQPSELIRLAAICEPVVYAAPVEVKVSSTEINGSADALGEICSAPKIVGNVVAEYKAKAAHLSAFCFAASVAHSKTLAKRFNDEGIQAAHVDGSTTDDEREAAFKDLEAGRIRVLCSFGVYIEGVDIPRAKCAIIARPTSSLVVWIQSTGRVLRPFEGISPVILDHGGNTARLGYCTADREWSLDGENNGAVRASSPYKTCQHCYALVRSTAPCPLCLQAAPSREEAQIKADESIALEKLAAIEATPIGERRRFYEAMKAKGRIRNWKPIAAKLAYKSKYKVFPPLDWS